MQALRQRFDASGLFGRFGKNWQRNEEIIMGNTVNSRCIELATLGLARA